MGITNLDHRGLTTCFTILSMTSVSIPWKFVVNAESQALGQIDLSWTFVFGRKNKFEKTFSTTSDTAAAVKSLQSCPTLYDPIDGSPPGFPIPGILQARILEWGAIAFSRSDTTTAYIFKTYRPCNRLKPICWRHWEAALCKQDIFSSAWRIFQRTCRP